MGFAHRGDQIGFAASFLLGANHDRRAVCIVGADVDTAMPAEFLKTDPDVGLDVFDQMPDMDRPVRVGQGTGDEDASGAYKSIGGRGRKKAERRPRQAGGRRGGGRPGRPACSDCKASGPAGAGRCERPKGSKTSVKIEIFPKTSGRREVLDSQRVIETARGLARHKAGELLLAPTGPRTTIRLARHKEVCERTDRAGGPAGERGGCRMPVGAG